MSSTEQHTIRFVCPVSDLVRSLQVTLEPGEDDQVIQTHAETDGTPYLIRIRRSVQFELTYSRSTPKWRPLKVSG